MVVVWTVFMKADDGWLMFSWLKTFAILIINGGQKLVHPSLRTVLSRLVPKESELNFVIFYICMNCNIYKTIVFNYY